MTNLYEQNNLIQLVTRQMDELLTRSQRASWVDLAGIAIEGRRTRPNAHCCGLEMARTAQRDAHQSTERILGQLADSANTVGPVEHGFDSSHCRVNIDRREEPIVGAVTDGLELTKVVIVDQDDNELGHMNKAEVHEAPGHLHRAVSLCIYDDSERVLLQQRHIKKYHFATQWSNACCTHPLPAESNRDAIQRAALDELGVRLGTLDYCGSFIYRAEDDHSRLVEWEFDHVFAATVRDTLNPDPDEVADLMWCTISGDGLIGMDHEIQTPWLLPVLSVFSGWRAGSIDRTPPLEP